jgi:hypothetical protein
MKNLPINKPITIGFMEYNNMRELNVCEIEAVNGGNVALDAVVWTLNFLNKMLEN